jgi:uncharacterized protein HemX
MFDNRDAYRHTAQQTRSQTDRPIDKLKNKKGTSQVQLAGCIVLVVAVVGVGIVVVGFVVMDGHRWEREMIAGPPDHIH